MKQTERKLISIDTPKAQPGFLGAGHLASPVVMGEFKKTDPFIFLMDDVLDKKDTVPVGGPHPHAGFETVSLLLEGEIGDELHTMKQGDMQLMTAGSGVVHTETIDKISKMRLMQLWLALPKANRWAPPRLQDLKAERVPTLSTDQLSIKLYSGSFAGLESPVIHYTPLLLADIRMQADYTGTFEVPGDFNTFIYVLDGTLIAGSNEAAMSKGQVGWLDLPGSIEPTSLRLRAGEQGARFLVYGGKPTGDEIVSHGPFIADSVEDIQQLYTSYRRGGMQHINSLPKEHKLVW
jgi:redox-sensitive bicupin YhaK (pirin superfamily)